MVFLGTPVGTPLGPHAGGDLHVLSEPAKARFSFKMNIFAIVATFADEICVPLTARAGSDCRGGAREFLATNAKIF